MYSPFPVPWQQLTVEHVRAFLAEAEEEGVSGIEDPVEASELVDELYKWLSEFTAERADAEEQAVVGRQAKSGSARLRNIVEQAFAVVDTTPPWLTKADALRQTWELPDETPDTSGQGSLLGFDGHIEQPTDVKFGEQWARFESEARADFVRTLAASRMAPRKLMWGPSWPKSTAT
jgi:hypothetical protein